VRSKGADARTAKASRVSKDNRASKPDNSPADNNPADNNLASRNPDHNKRAMDKASRAKANRVDKGNKVGRDSRADNPAKRMAAKPAAPGKVALTAVPTAAPAR
jgi:hypothetical protein